VGRRAAELGHGGGDVTTTAERPVVPATPAPPPRHNVGILRWLTTTDHKVIGLSYMTTSILFFLVGGVLALAMRTQLSQPDLDLVSPETYNEFFTMHGSIMIYLFVVPLAFGIANYIVPLQIGAPDVAFPRLNALAYWLYLFGGLAMVSGFLTASGAANFGWFAYAPLSGATYAPGVGPDLWIVGVVVTSTAGVLGAVNLVTTIFMLRAPGMTMFRMPIFTWNMLVVSTMVLLTFPVLTAALAMLFADRHLDAHIFEVEKGGTPVLWQHMFWFFGHPEVYIIALPFFGVVTEIFPVFSRRPVFGYKGIIFATLAIGGLSVGVWAHHMFATGVVQLAFFSALSLLIAVPTGVKFFNWIGTMWRGQLRFQTPLLFSIGFLIVFLLGGITGVQQALAPVDFNVTDTYFVVAHMHYVIMALVLAAFGGIYYWFPKFTGRMLDERLGKIHFWLFFIGINVTFLVQHQLGLEGMPRRVVTYRSSDDFGVLNMVSTIGSFILGIGVLVFVWNVIRSLRHGERAGNDPWDGQTLEWATTSPPPERNFDSLPPIRSERPFFDQKYGDLVKTKS
jgi:cytochrome c oxidase subunit I